MQLLLCLTMTCVGGWRHNACCNTGMLYCNPCVQQTATACDPVEVAKPVAKTTEEEDAAPVRRLTVERDPALAAADRLESLSQELPLADSAVPVADVETGLDPDVGTAVGFTPGFGGGYGNGGGGGFGFGGGQAIPRGTGFGFGGGGGTGDSETGAGLDQGQIQDGLLAVNVSALISNINNLSQNQYQWQYQTQSHCCCNNGGNNVPLPATLWVGLLGSLSVVAARRRGWIG